LFGWLASYDNAILFDNCPLRAIGLVANKVGH